VQRRGCVAHAVPPASIVNIRFSSNPRTRLSAGTWVADLLFIVPAHAMPVSGDSSLVSGGQPMRNDATRPQAVATVRGDHGADPEVDPLASPIRIGASHGKITLCGEVQESGKRALAGGFFWLVSEVSAVQNQLKTVDESGEGSSPAPGALRRWPICTAMVDFTHRILRNARNFEVSLRHYEPQRS
jgi:hypothetical protein